MLAHSGGKVLKGGEFGKHKETPEIRKLRGKSKNNYTYF